MADIVNLNFRADGDFGPFIAQVNRAMAVLSKFRNEKLLDPSLGLDKAKFDAAVDSFRQAVAQSGLYQSQIVNVTSSTEKFGKSLAGQNLKLKEYYKAYVDFRRSTVGQIRMLAQEQVRIQNSVVKSMGRDIQGASKALVISPTGIDALANASAIARQEVMIFNKVLRDGATSLINWGKNTQWAGRQLTVGLTLPIMLFGKTASEAFRKADAELTRLSKVYGGIGETSAAQLAEVRKNVAELSKTLAATYGASFEETLALAADIAATGAEGNDLLAATAETTRLATLGEVDRQEAMKATLALQSAFKLNTTELTESINMLNAVENQTSTTLQDLVEAIPKAGPVIKGLGGDVGTLALFLTAMREGGINAAEGANALKSGLASLINPTKQAVEKMQGFGININEIVNSNAGDLVGLIFDLQAALDKLDPLQKQQAIEQLFGKYQFARIGALLNNIGREGSQSLQVLDIMKASTEDLAATADRELTALTESASGRYKRALETFKASLAEFGEPFLDVFTNILKVGSKLIEVFAGLPKPIKMFLTGIAGLTALAGPLIMLTGLFGNFLGYIIKGVAAFRQLKSGAGAFELITTATVAADQVADAYTKTQYDQISATKILRVELEKLEMAYYDLARAAAGGAPGPRPPGGAGGVGGVPPIMPFPMGGGPMIMPGGPGVSGSIVPTSKAVTGYMEELGPIAQRGLTKRQELEQILSAMSPEEADRYLMERAKGSQRSVESMGLGKNRGSAQVLPFTHAGLIAMGLATEGGEVRGQYREETGAGSYNIYGEVSGGHLDPEEKERVRKAHYEAAIKEGKTPAQAASIAERRIAAGNVPEPKALGMSVGTMPGQEKLLTREGAMAVVIGEELMKEEFEKSKGKQAPFKRLGERFKAAKRSVAVADDLPIASKEELKKLTQQGGLVSAPSAQQPVVPTSSTAGKTGGARTTAVPVPLGTQPIIDMDKLDDLEKSSDKTSKNFRQSAKHAMKFSGAIAGSVGTLGMVSSMMMSMNGSTNKAAMNMANFLMYAGFAVPAIQGLGAGLRTVGAGLSRNAGLAGLLGRGLAFLGTGPGMIAIATVTTLIVGYKKLMEIHAETLRKARADISVTEEALKEFGGAALTAKDNFATYIKTVEALRQRLIDQNQAKGVPGLPTAEEIAKVKDQVKELFKDQIARVKDISNKQEALDFGRNLKSTLVVQGVEEKTASAIIASIFEQAGKSTMSIPVLLDIAGITTGDQGIEQLKKAAQTTFDEISDKLDGGSIKQKVAERFSEQLDLLSAAALAQVKDFEDLKNIIDVLPEGMQDLTFEQLNASVAGRTLLKGIKDTNPELYQAFRHAESLAAALQLTAGSALGLSTTLSGVTGQFALAGQNAMKIVASQEYAKSGIQEYYSRLISGEQNTISNLKKRMKAELEANENRKKAIEDQIDLEKEKIDQIKDEAEARKDLLREQQKQKDFELDLAQLRIKQDVAMRVGNFAEAAMIGLDIEKEMQNRSVDLAERAIDEKEKREIEFHEARIDLLEEEKEKIKELTDEQKASIESRYNKLIEKHNKAIEKYRQDAIKSANTFTDLFNKAAAGNVNAYKDLQNLLKQTGGDLGILGNTFNEFLRKTVNSFSQAFGDSLAALLGPDYRVKDGVIQKGRPGPKGRGIKYEDVTTIADLFGIKTGFQGTGPLGIGTGDENILDNTRSKSVPTKYGTFNITETSPGSQVYVAKYKKGNATVTIPINNPTAKQIEDYLDRVEAGRQVQALYTGGKVSGPGTSTSDSIPAYLSDGEYVLSAKAVNAAGGPEVVDEWHNALRRKDGGPASSKLPPNTISSSTTGNSSSKTNLNKNKDLIKFMEQSRRELDILRKVLRQNIDEYNSPNLAPYYYDGIKRPAPEWIQNKFRNGNFDDWYYLKYGRYPFTFKSGTGDFTYFSDVEAALEYEKLIARQRLNAILNNPKYIAGIAKGYKDGGLASASTKNNKLRNILLSLTDITAKAQSFQNPLMSKLFGSDLSRRMKEIIKGSGTKGDFGNLGMSLIPFGAPAKGAVSAGATGIRAISQLTPEMKSFSMADIDAKAMQDLLKLDPSSIKIPETGITFSPDSARAALLALKEGITSSSAWEIVQAQRETLLKKKYPKVDFSDVSKFNEYYAKEFYNLLPDDSIKLFKGVRSTIDGAWRTGQKDLGTYFSTNPYIAAMYSAMIGKAKIGEELPMFGIDKKISELKNFLGEGAVRGGNAQGSMEFPQILGGESLSKLLPTIYSLPGQVYGQIFGPTATSLKNIKNLWPTGFAGGGYVRKFHDWNGTVPGPYGQEVNAILKAGTEGVYQNEYINNLQKDSFVSGDNTYNINVNVTNPGATADQIASAIEAKMRLTNQRVGTARTVRH